MSKYNQINGIFLGTHYKGGTSLSDLELQGVSIPKFAIAVGEPLMGKVSFNTEDHMVEILALASGNRAYIVKVVPVSGSGEGWYYSDQLEEVEDL